MPHFHRDHLDFYFEEHGSGIPFIFSHGLSGNADQAMDLVGTVPGFRLVLYDNRGHGKTREPGNAAGLNFQTMAADALALLDHLSIEKAVVGGVSMGAAIALAFCLAHPQRTLAAILTRPAWLNQPEPPNLAMFPAIAAMIQNAGIEPARRLFEQSRMYAAWKEEYPPAATMVEGFFTGRTSQAIVATYQAIPRSVPYHSPVELRRISVPVLVLANRRDPLHPFEYAEALARAIPQAQLKEFPSKAEGLEKHTAAFRNYLGEFLRSAHLLESTN
jgi:pimeloyl-ACP methyl ester carboxylesterase